MEYLIFTGLFIVSHIFAYYFAGAITYPLFYKRLHGGSESLATGPLRISRASTRVRLTQRKSLIDGAYCETWRLESAAWRALW